MRLALVCTGYPPEVGGVGDHVAAVAEGLAARGHEVEVLSQSGGVNSAVVEQGHITVRRWPEIAPLPYLGASPGLWRFLRANRARYDVVHAHNYHSAAPASAYLAGCRPLVVTGHMHLNPSTKISALLDKPYSRLFGRVVRASAALTADSKAEAGILRSRFPGAEPVVIPSGIPPYRFGRPTAVAPPEGTVPLVLTAARLVSYKRIDLLVDAMKYLPDLRLVIVGDGPELPLLRRRATELGTSERTAFAGTVSEERLTELYLEASVVASLSSLEAFGRVPVEGLAAGARVIVSDTPVHRDLKQFDEHGSLVFFDTAEGPEALASVIRQAAQQGPVPASRLVPSWDEVARRHEDLYASVVRDADTRQTSRS